MYVTSSFKAIAITAMLATSLIFTGCGESDPAETDNTNETGSDLETIAAIAAGNDDFSTLVAALTAADLVDTFNGSGDFTVFAPTNAAFDALPEGTLDALLADTDALTAILKYHVLATNVPSTALVAGKNFAETLQGDNAVVNVSDAGVTINQANVTATDIVASNGVIHVIDAIILPPTNVAEKIYTSASHTTLFAAVEAAGLGAALGGAEALTVFAPTDDAFAALPEGTVESLLADIPTLTAILTNHAVGATVPSSDLTEGRAYVETLAGTNITIELGTGVTVYGENSANVTVADVMATNGVIHVVDAVILPAMSIGALARTTASLSILTSVLESTGLYSAVADLTAELTVFAPLDSAFTPLIDDGTIASLNDDQLQAVLLYHAFPGSVFSSDIDGTVVVESLMGQELTVNGSASGVSVNDTAVVQLADIEAANGVIHVIDQVLIPAL
ncbi:MAG: fasciclin domain-containing protein [Deltaproteobacteria bacterium]|jgi:uncharacterized surface protein with fasciclin (FAS1) repeats|nr:fasciclin domain-containing protein [Deltaproteobacteria bacterium]MBT6434335.1 fasciclin domain-containing protein [Deltaproteobacteria bacterium]